MSFALSGHVWSCPNFPGYAVDRLHVPVILRGFPEFSIVFRLGPFVSQLFSFVISGFCRPSHLTIVPFDGPVICGVFRISPLRLSHLTLVLFDGPVISGPSGFPRFGPAISQFFFLMILSCPDLSDFSAPAQPSHN